MILDFRNLHALEEFMNERSFVYFRLTGGLGNQLFGLSEAYGIYKEVGREVAIDVGSLEHTSGSEPEWLEWSYSQNWITLVRVPKNLSSQLNLVNLGDDDKHVNRLDSIYFTGWRFSLDRIRKIGLFREGDFPFDVVNSGRAETVVHYRVGDYANAKGIGVLEACYYYKAIRLIDSKSKIEFFSDDNESAQELIKALNLSYAIVSSATSAIDILYQISNAKSIIAANSTLSWWGIYFSHSTNVICPRPFYLQNWNFDSDARFPNVLYLSRFKNLRQGISTWTLWRIRSARIRNKP